MQSVSSEFLTAIAQDTITLKPRVQIEFGNNRFNGDQQVTATSVKQVQLGIHNSITKTVTAAHDINFCLTSLPSYTPSIPSGHPSNFLINQNINWWSQDEAFNNKNRVAMRWAVCDRGATLDNGYRLLPIFDAKQFFDPTEVPIPIYEHGWWSNNKSDGSGNFGSPEQLNCFFDNIRNINQIDLYFFEGYPNMKMVTFGYFDDLNNTIIVESNYSISSGTYYYSFPLNATVRASGLYIQIQATANPNDYARLSEMQGLYVVDVSDDVVSFQLNQNREKYSGTSPAPNVVSATLDLTLDNTTANYSPSNSLSTNYPYISHDNKITVAVGVETSPNVFEYCNLGIFYADEWNSDSLQATAEVQCRDYSKYLQDEAVGYSKYWINTTPQTVIPDLLARTGLSADQIIVDPNATNIYGLLYVHADSFWNFLGQLAQADEARFGFDQDGNFHYYGMSYQYNAPYNSSVFNFDWDNNIVDGKESTQLYINSIIINVNGVTVFDRQVQTVWTPPRDSTGDTDIILSWATLANSLSDTDTEIVTVENLDNPQANLMPLSGWVAIESELIAFDSRDHQTLSGLTRGVGGTIPASHGAGAYIGEARYYPQQMFSIFPVLNINPVLSFRQYPTTIQDQINDLIASGHFNTAQQLMVAYDSNITSLPSTDAPLTGSGALPPATLSSPVTSTHVGDPDWPYSTAVYGPLILDLHNQSQARFMFFVADAFNCTLAIQNTVPFYTPIDGSGLPSYYSSGGTAGGPIVGYNVYMGTESNGEDVVPLNGSPLLTNSYTATGLADDTTYYFKVKSINSNGELPGSEEVASTPTSGSPLITSSSPSGTITATSGDTQVNLIWVAPLGNTYDWQTLVAGTTPIQGAQRIRLNKKPIANLNNLRLVRKHGKTQIEISNPWIQTKAHAEKIANYLMNEFNTPRAVIDVDAIANPALQLGDQVTISNLPELGIMNTNYYIINIAYKFDGSLQANYTLKEVNNFA